MVKKKIRKFFNTVSINLKTPVLFEERKRKNTAIPWCTALAIVAAAVISLWFVLKDLPQNAEKEA